MALETESLSTEITVSAKKSGLRDFFTRLFREKKIGALGGLLVLIFLLVGIFADFLAPHSIDKFSIRHRLDAPTSEFILGTDNLGRDVFSRVIHGARISMIVGLGASGLHIVIAVLLGLISGYWGGKFDILLQRLVDAFMTFPALFIIITFMAVLPRGMVSVIIVIGVWWGINGTRIIRGVVLSAKENVYVEAARAVGCGTWRILWRHILPQLVAPIIVMFTIALGSAILTEAEISFLGFGIPPPQPSWGGMLSLEGRKYMLQAPWLALWPGVCLAIVVFGINMFGDALRDLLDPRLKGGAGRFGAARKAIRKFYKQMKKSS